VWIKNAGADSLSQPWLEIIGGFLQIGLKPKGQGNLSGTDGGGEIYSFDNQKVVAAAIPWVHPDPTPLRTSNLRAPGDLARSFASESFTDEIASDLAVDPVQLRGATFNHISSASPFRRFLRGGTKSIVV
jgi:hypothetical protein